jgi:hypothetical protein
MYRGEPASPLPVTPAGEAAGGEERGAGGKEKALKLLFTHERGKGGNELGHLGFAQATEVGEWD